MTQISSTAVRSRLQMDAPNRYAAGHQDGMTPDACVQILNLSKALDQVLTGSWALIAASNGVLVKIQMVWIHVIQGQSLMEQCMLLGQTFDTISQAEICCSSDIAVQGR